MPATKRTRARKSPSRSTLTPDPRPLTPCILALLLTAPLLAATPDDAVQTLLTIEPTKQSPRNSEGDLVVLKDGTLFFAYTRFTGGSGDESTADIVARTSDDGGKTWSDDRMLVPREDARNVMSVSILRLPGDDLLLFYLRKTDAAQCTLFVRRSADEFRTLGPPVRVTAADGYHVVNNGRVIRLSSGRLVAPAALHPCPDGTLRSFSAKAVVRAFLSDDDGKTWRGDATPLDPPAKSAPTFQEPGVVELKDKRVMMWIRTDQPTQYQSFSTDGGEHWSNPEAGPLISAQLSPASIARLPWNGRLVAVWNDHATATTRPSRKRTPLCVAVSKDEGRTWTAGRPIETDPDGWYCYTSITPLKDRIILSYCAGDKKIGHLNRLKIVAISKAWLDVAE